MKKKDHKTEEATAGAVASRVKCPAKGFREDSFSVELQGEFASSLPLVQAKNEALLNGL